MTPACSQSFNTSGEAAFEEGTTNVSLGLCNTNELLHLKISPQISQQIYFNEVMHLFLYIYNVILLLYSTYTLCSTYRYSSQYLVNYMTYSIFLKTFFLICSLLPLPPFCPLFVVLRRSSREEQVDAVPPIPLLPTLPLPLPPLLPLLSLHYWGNFPPPTFPPNTIMLIGREVGVGARTSGGIQEHIL